MGLIPCKIDYFIYDPRWTEKWLIDHLRDQDGKSDDLLWLDGAHCYEKLFDEMEMNWEHNMLMICDSDDIGEDWPCGHYSYYSGIIDNRIQFLYHQSPSHIEYASRLSLYGPEYMIEVRGDSIYLQIYDQVKSVTDIFIIPDEEERRLSIMKFLKTTDRVTFAEDDINLGIKNGKTIW